MPPSSQTLTDAVFQIAEEEFRRGVFETGNNNRGERIDEYSIAANGATGQAWCAKFAWWCYDKAATKLRVRNPFPKIFAAAALETWALREKKIVTTPSKGHVFIKLHRHVGLFKGPVLSGGKFTAIEGNTWTGTIRKDGVYETTNTKLADCTFVRLC